MELHRNMLQPLAIAEANMRRGRRATYTHPLQSRIQNHTDKTSDPVQDFLYDFNRTISTREDECHEIRKKYPSTVGRFYNELVPMNISQEEFWQRYFYRCDPDFILKEWLQFDIQQGFNNALSNCQEAFKASPSATDDLVQLMSSNQNMDEHIKLNFSYQIEKIQNAMSMYFEEAKESLHMCVDDIREAISQGREMEDAEEMMMKNAAAEASARRSRKDTYTEPLINKMKNYTKEEEKDLSDFIYRFNRRVLSSEACESVCKDYPWTVARFYTELVPSEVSHEEFWQRYLYRCDPEKIIKLWEFKETKQRLEDLVKIRLEKQQEEKDREKIEVGLLECNDSNGVFISTNRNEQDEIVLQSTQLSSSLLMEDVSQNLITENIIDLKSKAEKQESNEVFSASSGAIACIKRNADIELEAYARECRDLLSNITPVFGYLYLFELKTTWMMNDWRRQLLVSKDHIHDESLKGELLYLPPSSYNDKTFDLSQNISQEKDKQDIAKSQVMVSENASTSCDSKTLNDSCQGEEEEEEPAALQPPKNGECETSQLSSDEEVAFTKDAHCFESPSSSVGKLLQEEIKTKMLSHMGELKDHNPSVEEGNHPPKENKNNMSEKCCFDHQEAKENENDDNSQENSITNIVSSSFIEAENLGQREKGNGKIFTDAKGTSYSTSVTGDLSGDLSVCTPGNVETWLSEDCSHLKTGHLIEKEYKLKSKEHQIVNLTDNLSQNIPNDIALPSNKEGEGGQILFPGKHTVEWGWITEEFDQEVQASIGEAKDLWENTIDTFFSTKTETSENLVKPSDSKNDNIICKQLNDEEPQRDEHEGARELESTRDHSAPALGVVVDVAQVDYICEDITISDDDLTHSTAEKEKNPNIKKKQEEKRFSEQSFDEDLSIDEVTEDGESQSSKKPALYQLRSMAAAAEAQLRRGRETTYTTPLRKDAHHTYDDNEVYIEFLLNFRSTFEAREYDYRKLCRVYPSTVGRFYRKLVPRQLSPEEFWKRYTYRCNSDSIIKEWDRAAANNMKSFGNFW